MSLKWAMIIAVILMLFSQRARVNGPLFLLGWVFALAAACAAVAAIVGFVLLRSARTVLDGERADPEPVSA